MTNIFDGVDGPVNICHNSSKFSALVMISDSPPPGKISRLRTYHPQFMCESSTGTIFGSDNVYSCFEKGCPTKPYATIPKGSMGNGDSWSLIEDLGVSAT